jgi:HAD superfamily hydrolase (TIGR01509 family)
VLPGPIRAAVFDMDGVLIDTEPLWCAAEAELLERHGDRFTAADAEATHGRSIEDTVAVYATRLVGADVAEIRDELTAAMRVHYAAGPPLRPGARDLVEALERRMPLGVASNTDGELVRLVLERVGLLDAFAVIASGADIGRAKPYPDVYLAACQGMGIEPRWVVAFEDSPAGVRAAKAAGMVCVGIPDRDGVDLAAAGADLVVPSLGDVLGLTLG